MATPRPAHVNSTRSKEGRAVTEQPLGDLFARLDHERELADRHYHEALAAVDRAVQQLHAWPEPPARRDESRVADLNQLWRVLREDVPHVDQSWRGRLRGFVWRLVGPPLERQQAFNAALVDHLNRNARSEREVPRALVELTGAFRTALEGVCAFESRLVQFLQTVTAYVDTKDRRHGSQELTQHLTFVEERLFAVTREVERLLAQSPQEAPPSTAPAPGVFAGPIAATTYVNFEDCFRGAREDIGRRVEDYVPILTGHRDVVDVGCGRGELLEALRARGIIARGTDSNHAMVELCRGRGLVVEHADALSYLRQMGGESVGALVAIQVVEHFTPDYLMAFLSAAYHALRPGAPIVLETINPACWMAFFETYIRDPTHQQALHPETLKYLVQASGFTQVDIQYRQPVGESDRLDRVALDVPGDDPAALRTLVAAINAHADKLNARLFSFADYAVIARR
jgi:SAM-dependent methyltransferase